MVNNHFESISFIFHFMFNTKHQKQCIDLLFFLSNPCFDCKSKTLKFIHHIGYHWLDHWLGLINGADTLDYIDLNSLIWRRLALRLSKDFPPVYLIFKVMSWFPSLFSVLVLTYIYILIFTHAIKEFFTFRAIQVFQISFAFVATPLLSHKKRVSLSVLC